MQEEVVKVDSYGKTIKPVKGKKMSWKDRGRGQVSIDMPNSSYSKEGRKRKMWNGLKG